jgi:putative ABC transport system permease protein
VVQDVRYAIRSLRKAPGFAAIAVLTLGIGIGVNTAIVSVAAALLLRPLGDLDADRIVAVVTGQKGPVSPADYADFRRMGRSFAELAAYRQHDANIAGDGPAERVYAADVTPNFFAALQIDAAIGRTFAADDGEAAILSHGFWQRRFGGEADILGRTVDVDGRPRTIVGVLPRRVEVPVPTDVWLPLTLTPAEAARRDVSLLRAVGRLGSAASLDDAQAEIATIAAQLETEYPATNRNRRARVMPLREFVQGTITRAAIFLLLSLVAVVLLVACANIAGLQLAHATNRERDVAVRAALGASAWRIARLVLVENVVIAALGGALSIVVAFLCIDALVRSMPGEIARLIPGFTDISIDSRALAFTLAATVATAFATATAPALRSALARPNDTLKEGHGGTPSRHRVRNLFIVGQIAVAFTLLIVAALFVNGLRGLLDQGAAHDPQRVLVLSVNLPQARYADAESRQRLLAATLDRLAAIPGVRQAAAFSAIPLSNNGVTWSAVDVDGQPPPSALPRFGAVVQSVSADYFAMMRVPLQRGRLFDRGDRPGTQGVAIVSAVMAERYWPNRDAVGRALKLGSGADAQSLVVVGIVGDVLYDWTNRAPEPVVYVPFTQMPRAATQFGIRVDGEPAAFVDAARTQIAAIDPLLPVFGAMSLANAIRESLVGTSQIVVMTAILGGLALLIAVVGLYGVIASVVAAQTREFGVRMALGATRGDVFRSVLRRGLGLGVVGVGSGVLLAMAATRGVRGLFFGAGGNDVWIWIEVAIALTVATVLAACVPAHRATKTDPIAALKTE